MAEREVVVVECDGCGVEGDLRVETGKIGRKAAREVDVCPACDEAILAPARALLAKGRRPGTGSAAAPKSPRLSLVPDSA